MCILDVMVLAFLGKKLVDIAAGKGRSGAWILLLVALWFLGQGLGLALATLINLSALQRTLSAEIWAALGAFAAFGVVLRLPPAQPPGENAKG